MVDAAQRWLTPPQIGRFLAVDPAKVLQWIRSGQISAANVATNARGPPRWRIAPAELEAFLQRRQSQSPAPAPRPRRRRKISEIKEFFKTLLTPKAGPS
jgi:hypothetical protein